MKQTEIDRLIDEIKPTVSGIVGQNHSLSADVKFEDILGIRRVEILITHEANANKEENKERIQNEMAPVLEQLINALCSNGRSVTESENINSYVCGDNRACAIIRCSLTKIQQQEQPEVASTEALSTPVLDTDSGSAIKWD